MAAPRITQTSILSHIPSWNSNYLAVRAASAHKDTGETIHNVIGGFYHGSYNPLNPRTLEYKGAVLKVCAVFDIPLDCAKFGEMFAVIYSFISLSVLCNAGFAIYFFRMLLHITHI
jgi:hypothetical protein